MYKQIYFGDNIVKEFESEFISRFVGDGDVKIGDGIGYLDVLILMVLERCV